MSKIYLKILAFQIAATLLSLAFAPASASAQTADSPTVISLEDVILRSIFREKAVIRPPLDSPQALCADGGCEGSAYFDFDKCLYAAGRWGQNEWSLCQAKWAERYLACKTVQPIANSKAGGGCLDGGCALRLQILFYDCFSKDINSPRTNVQWQYETCHRLYQQRIDNECPQLDTQKPAPEPEQPVTEAKPFSYLAGEEK